MRRTFAVICILSGLTTPLAAQLHVETGGGQGRLDQLSPSSLTALGGGAAAAFGANRIELTGNAENRFGLGATGLATGHWFYQFTPLGWQLELGPEATIAHDIGTPWAREFSGHLVAERTFGPLALRAEWQQGVVQTGDLSRSWRRPALGVEFRSVHWQLGTGWRSTSAADTSDASTRISNDSGPAPQHGGYNFQEISAHLGWRAGLFSASARAGRRFGFSVQPETWWEGQAAFEVTPFVSLTAKTGHLASDVLLGLRGGQYTTLGLRLDLLRRPAGRDLAGPGAERAGRSGSRIGHQRTSPVRHAAGNA